MKSIGILGGMAPASTLKYYQILFRLAENKGWGKKYPEIIIFSINFQEFYELISKDKEKEIISLLSDKVEKLQKAGADFALLASNTPHRFIKELEASSSIPLLNIAEATAERAETRGFEKVALLGTKYTMEGDFYQESFHERNMEIVTPRISDREFINQIIFEELVKGELDEEKKDEVIRTVEDLEERESIDAVVLGCTELPIVFDSDNLGLPALNSTRIHAEAAFEYALGT